MLGPCHVLGSTCGHVSHAMELHTGSVSTCDVREHTPPYTALSTFPMSEHPHMAATPAHAGGAHCPLLV